MWRILLLVLCSVTLGGQDFLARAQDAMQKGEWEQALVALDSLAAAGRVSPSLYQAQGNAYVETGDLGRAILAFERGLRLQPGNKGLKNNLRYARGEAGITRPRLEEFFGVRAWRWAGAALGVASARWLALAFWMLAVLAAGAWYLYRRELTESRRFALLPLAGLFLALAFTFYQLASSRAALLSERDEAILVAERAALRVAPGAEATLEEELSAGLKLRVLDEFGEYTKVSLESGRQGWLPGASLERI